MIIYDTSWYGKPYLRKFEGNMSELGEKYGTYKSFGKAKELVEREIEAEISSLKQRLLDVQSIQSQDELDFVENPFTGYLRSVHGELERG